ncbi:MAG: hypothetical protein REI09_11950 [Candidatus Dactylopiibacterium sp.]|nr:hypothetical protein [Candidatus Dactylopiibacterium sp.]
MATFTSALVLILCFGLGLELFKTLRQRQARRLQPLRVLSPEQLRLLRRARR